MDQATDFLVNQLDNLEEKERAIRFARHKGIAEANNDFHLSVSLPDEYKYTVPSDEYDIPETLLGRFEMTMRIERIRGALDALREAGKEDDIIIRYLSEKYDISQKYAKNFLDDDSDFCERVGSIV